MTKLSIIEADQLAFRGNALYSTQFDDIYYSTENGLEESRYVFLEGNRLGERFAASSSFTVAEIGFGSSLNFLLTWQLWQQRAPKNGCLHYISTEKYPLSPAALHKALATWPELETLADELIKNYSSPLPGFHRLQLDHGRVSLTLLFGDALDQLKQLNASVDAWFFDGFAPAKNGDLWSTELMRAVAQRTKPHGSYATFSAARVVKQALTESGFTWEKQPGFGHKREMLTGELKANPPPISDKAPWFHYPINPMPKGKVAVVGAGIAGCAVAAKLAGRGWKVILLDRRPAPAQAASGNRMGVMMPYLTADHSPLSRFSLNAFQLTCSALKQLESVDVWPGVYQLAHTPKEKKRHDKLLEQFGESVFHYQDPQAIASNSGCAQPFDGLYFPNGCSLQPPQLCKALLNQSAENIEQRFGFEVLSIEKKNRTWQLTGTSNQTMEVDLVVVTTGSDLHSLTPFTDIPLQRMKGQVSYLPTSCINQKITHALCHEGYITPSVDGRYTIGASYESDWQSGDDECSERNHQENLDTLEKLLPCGSAASSLLTGKASVRATTPDRFPVVGQLPDFAWYREHYSDLCKGKPGNQYSSGRYIEGLYLLSGLGSRGMTHALLCAELLSGLINNEPLPLAQESVHNLHPARLLIRALKRGQAASLL